MKSSGGNSQMGIRDNEGIKGVIAKEDIVKDSVIFYLKGTISTRPTKYTIQLGRNKHLTFPAARKGDDDLDYCWQYLNHSCEPNGYINTAERTLRAARNIRRGEEITFNYLTTESEMAAPFNCICGSAHCFGFIQGHNFLSSDQAKRLSLTVGAVNDVNVFQPLVLTTASDLENSQAGSTR